jgi:hypothetical protein
MRRRLTLGHRDNLALELITGAELHETLLSIRKIAMERRHVRRGASPLPRRAIHLSYRI